MEQRIRRLESQLKKIESDKTDRNDSQLELNGNIGNTEAKTSETPLLANWSGDGGNSGNDIEASGLVAGGSGILASSNDQHNATAGENSRLIVSNENTTNNNLAGSDESHGIASSGITSEQAPGNGSLNRGLLFLILGITVIGLIVAWLLSY